MQRPSAVKALAQWAFTGASAAALLGPATALGRLSPGTALKLYRYWAGLGLKRLGVEVTVDNRSGYDGKRGVLLVDLHQQTLLTALIYPRALPFKARLIVNVEFAAVPLVGWLALSLGAVPIVRQKPEQARAAMAPIAARIRAGESFGMSIEGVRSKDGGLSPYKKGAAVLAIEAQCDIIPFMSFGEWERWPRGEWRVRPGRVHCVVYPPVPTKGLTYDDRDALVAKLRALAEAELEQHRRGGR